MKRSWFASPYAVWMLLFTIAPMIFVVIYALTDSTGIFTMENLMSVGGAVYMKVLWRSMYLALACTAICLLLGYPTAYFLASKEFSKNQTLFVLILLPMWMNFLLRTYAMMSLMEDNGIINTFLKSIGLQPLKMIGTEGAVLVGMVYNYLPFMVLPIYVSIEQLDHRLLEAASDLGASPFTAFRKITLPLTMPGIAAGTILVFISSLGMFVVPDVMGGAKSALIGNLIQNQFLSARDWPFGGALSIVLALLSLVLIVLYYKALSAQQGGGKNAEDMA